jgi:hypothetical protein
LEKAKWGLWKEADKWWEALDLQINGPLLFEWDDLSEEALQEADKCLRQRWKEMVLTSHFGERNEARATDPSPPYHKIGSHAKELDKRKRKRKRKEKAGIYTSQDMGSGGDFTIYEDWGSTEEEDNKESNKAKVEIADSVETGSSGFFVFSPNKNCAGTIDSVIGGGGQINPQSSCGNGNKDNDNNNAQRNGCIGQDGLSLISYKCKCLVYPSREDGDTIVACFKSVVGTSLEKETNWILKILVKIQGADLRKFNKHKKRVNLWTGEYPPVMNCTFCCGTQGIEVWMGKHPLPFHAVDKWSCRIVIPDIV